MANTNLLPCEIVHTGISQEKLTTNTKEYWEILNSTCKDKICAVDINDYFYFIKGITETEDVSLAVENKL